MEKNILHTKGSRPHSRLSMRNWDILRKNEEFAERGKIKQNADLPWDSAPNQLFQRKKKDTNTFYLEQGSS